MSDSQDQIGEDLSREVLTQQQRSDLLQTLQQPIGPSNSKVALESTHQLLEEVKALERRASADMDLSPEALNSLLKSYSTIQNAFDAPFEYSPQDLQQAMAEFYKQYDAHGQQVIELIRIDSELYLIYNYYIQPLLDSGVTGADLPPEWDSGT
jgi:hypothetical protein